MAGQSILDGNKNYMEKRERIYVFDNVKVWLMIMVVLGHTVISHYGSSNIGIAYIWFFRGIYTMPLFFFISGYFTKPGGGKMDKLLRCVLLPFILFDAAYLLYEPLFNDSFTFRWASPGFAMWFLLVLFIYKILFPVLIKIKYIFPISVVVSLLIGFIPTGGIVSRIFCFFPFYLLGYYVNNSKELETIKRNILQPFKFKDGLVLSVLTILWATILYFKPGIAYFTTFTQNYNGDWLLLSLSICDCIRLLCT